MKIGVPKEAHPGETRVALVPEGVARLVQLGVQVSVERGLGATLYHSDEDYAAAGATLAGREELFSSADLILRVRKPTLEEVQLLKPQTIYISFLDPFRDPKLVQELAARRVSSLSMEMVPRSTRAQKIDALSSQANLAGYVAVILAAHALKKIFPMLTTPAGTLAPARVFVIGAGVAGLQAIATAKRLGAVVEAYDTRPQVEEEVRSVGARFVKIDLGETGQTAEGYAKALTEEQLNLQREAISKYCARSDVVITTAQLFGRPAPLIVTRKAVEAMRPGSVLVDLAVETGGNVEGSQIDQVVEHQGVQIIGLANLPARVAVHASQLYSNNLWNLVSELWNREANRMELNRDHEIVRSCLITHQGEVCNERLQQFLGS